MQPISRTFSSCKPEALYSFNSSPFVHSASPWQPPFYFLPLSLIPLVYTTHISGATQYMSFLCLACVYARSLQSCPTLCDLMDCSLPGSSVHEILRAWVGCRFLLHGIFLTRGLNPCLMFPALVPVAVLTTSATREAIPLNIVSSGFIHVVTCQDFLPFEGWIIFHRIDIPHLVYPFIHQWTFHLFPLFSYC